MATYTRWTFGKHKGEKVVDAPTSYLKWLVSHGRVLSAGHRWAVDAAKIELSKREAIALVTQRQRQLDARTEEQESIPARTHRSVEELLRTT